MIKRKRQRKPTKSDEEQAHRHVPPMVSKNNGSSKHFFGSSRRLLLAVFVIFFVSIFLFTRHLDKLTVLRCVTLAPVGMCLVLGIVTLRQGPWYKSILPLTLVTTVACSQLPLFIAAAIAVTAVILFALVTLPSSGSSLSNKSKTTQAQRPSNSPTAVVLATILLVTVLLTENFMIWVVSATFTDGQLISTAPPKLQDNGQILLTFAFQNLTRHQVVGLRRLWNVQWSLVSCLGASLVVVDVFEPQRHLYSLGVRAVLTLAAARFIRTASFVLTVLPSQVRNCYQEHYPYPPPTDWYEWIWVGLLPASHGGCNDLIISGHATVTSTLASVVASVSDNGWFSIPLWTMVALDYAVEIYEGFHYSVDMWLGMVVVSLLWRVLYWCEGDAPIHNASTSPSQQDNNNNKSWTTPSARDVLLYSIPGVIAYLQLVLFPKWTANFLIVGYVLFAAGIFLRFVWRQEHNAVYLHYAQHTILCLLYMAFGVYL